MKSLLNITYTMRNLWRVIGISLYMLLLGLLVNCTVDHDCDIPEPEPVAIENDIEDGFVSNGSPELVSNVDASLQYELKSSFNITTNEPNPFMIFIKQKDLVELNTKIKKATLKLTVKDHSSIPFDSELPFFQIADIGEDWDENQLNFKFKPNLRGGLGTRRRYNWNSFSIVKNEEIEIDITDLLNNLFERQLPFYGIEIRTFPIGENRDGFVTFYSSNVSDPNLWPKFDIEYDDGEKQVVYEKTNSLYVVSSQNTTVPENVNNPPILTVRSTSQLKRYVFIDFPEVDYSKPIEKAVLSLHALGYELPDERVTIDFSAITTPLNQIRPNLVPGPYGITNTYSVPPNSLKNSRDLQIDITSIINEIIENEKTLSAIRIELNTDNSLNALISFENRASNSENIPKLEVTYKQ